MVQKGGRGEWSRAAKLVQPKSSPSPVFPFSRCLKQVPKKEGENKTSPEECSPQTLTACIALQLQGCQDQTWLLWMESPWAHFCESVQFLPDVFGIPGFPQQGIPLCGLFLSLLHVNWICAHPAGELFQMSSG